MPGTRGKRASQSRHARAARPTSARALALASGGHRAITRNKDAARRRGGHRRPCKYPPRIGRASLNHEEVTARARGSPSHRPASTFSGSARLPADASFRDLTQPGCSRPALLRPPSSSHKPPSSRRGCFARRCERPARRCRRYRGGRDPLVSLEPASLSRRRARNRSEAAILLGA
jgi:hypothetical protein